MGRDSSGRGSLATRSTRRNHRILFAGYGRDMGTRQAERRVLLKTAEELATIDALIAGMVHPAFALLAQHRDHAVVHRLMQAGRSECS